MANDVNTEKFYAAVDGGVSRGIVGTGAVYGVGRTVEEALADSRRYGEDGDLDVIPCSPGAAYFVEAHGGAPDPRIEVRHDGVHLRPDPTR